MATRPCRARVARLREAKVSRMWVSGSYRRARGKFFGKNTIDLQWKMRANYNARPCAGFRKSVGARTVANNGKNNAQNNGNRSTPARGSRDGGATRCGTLGRAAHAVLG